MSFQFRADKNSGITRRGGALPQTIDPENVFKKAPFRVRIQNNSTAQSPLFRPVAHNEMIAGKAIDGRIAPELSKHTLTGFHRVCFHQGHTSCDRTAAKMDLNERTILEWSC